MSTPPAPAAHQPLLANQGASSSPPPKQQQQQFSNLAAAAGLPTWVTTPLGRVLYGILKILDSLLDWLPLIIVQVVAGSCNPLYGLGAGTAAAVFVLLLAYVKKLYMEHYSPLYTVVFPKILDVGQFFLYGFLFGLALLYRDDELIQNFLVLWFNPFTTAGIGLIMWISVRRGRSFVVDYVESGMPRPVFDKLFSKKWFREILDEQADSWVNILVAMTAIVSIQPLLVTILYEGDVSLDQSGHMQTLGGVFTGGQMLILFYGMWQSAKEGRKRERNSKRIKEVKQKGLEDWKVRDMYPPVDVEVQPPGGSRSAVTTPGSGSGRYRIRSLTTPGELDQASEVLKDAFRHEEILSAFITTDEGRRGFFQSSVKAVQYFNMVLGCGEAAFEVGVTISASESAEYQSRCVMACIPVLSASHEELDVFGGFEACVEHGFQMPKQNPDDPFDFELPDDALMALGNLKKKEKHGLNKNPFIFIAYFGADSRFKGRGYGRSLLQYVVEISETKGLPLVLETTSEFNIKQYEKYRFEVVDRVEEKDHLVLMVRKPSGLSE